MLKINNLKINVDQKIPVLHGVDLTINPGEIHAIMGPNGSGKSSLAHVLAGNEHYTITDGTIHFLNEDWTTLTPEERAHRGLFLAFQYPVALPGVNNLYFLKTAVNSLRQHKGLPEWDAIDFVKIAREYLQQLSLDEQFLHRSVNDGFSGGEKKRNEILQLLLLNPQLAVLDETDSGLDIDALQVVAKGVNSWHTQDKAVLLITHYQRLLDYIVPDVVHVLIDGRIVQSGDKNLALELEKNGYKGF